MKLVTSALLWLSACASAPAPVPWTSASCDMQADLLSAPASGREVGDTLYGPVTLTTHRAEFEGEIRAFGCREVPVGWLGREGLAAASKEAVAADVLGLGTGWTQARMEDKGAEQTAIMNGPDGRVAWVRSRATDSGRIHSDVIIGASEGAAKAFRASVLVRSEAAPFGGGVVRLAECMSSADFPAVDTASPHASFQDGIATVLSSDVSGDLERVWQLRCVVLGEALKARGARALFDEAIADTLLPGVWKLESQNEGKIGTFPSRDARFATGDGSAVLFARLVHDGLRFHMTTYMAAGRTVEDRLAGPLSAADRDEAVSAAARFMASLVFLHQRQLALP